jgi:solute carrier family 25 (mitochondrial phosphate transporter), member 3
MSAAPGPGPAGSPPARSVTANLRPVDYYLKCMFGGALACGVTHTAVAPIDIHKCRMQALSQSGRWPAGLAQGLKTMAAREGARGFVTGWAPTLVGYGAQGTLKFGLNEFFKDVYGGALGGEENLSKPARMAMWAAASGSAEVFADVALCPLEMTKVKMQVVLPAAAYGPTPGETLDVGRRLLPALAAMSRHSAETRFPFGSLVPLWGRQVPYTMIKFVGFYLTSEWVYAQLDNRWDIKKADMSTGQQLLVTFGSGYWAGIACALATQPMDNLVSLKGAAENRTKGWGQLASEAGMKRLFTAGLGPRVFMIGTLTGLQWYIYGATKAALGFGTS